MLHFSCGYKCYPSIYLQRASSLIIFAAEIRNEGNALTKILTLFVFIAFAGTSMGQWTLVGDVYESTPTSHQSIAIDSQGKPFVAFKDGSELGKASVITLDNDVWVNVGTAGFSMEGFSGTEHHQLIFDSNDTPYLIFRDLNDDSKPSVMKYNGSTWEYVGSPSFTASSVSNTCLAMDSQGTLYAGFREAGLADKCSVMKFDGGDWEYVGEPGFSTWDSQTAYISIATDPDDKVYVCYQEEAYGDGPSVLTWTGTTWEYIGDPGFSDGSTSFPSMVIDEGGTIFVGYRDNFHDNKCTVKKWDGANWADVGDPGFSPGSVSYTSIQVDTQNRVSVAFRDWENSSRTSVMRYADSSWELIGESGFSTQSANHQDLAVNAQGHLWVACEAGDVEVHRFVVAGCTDPFACNYEIDATDDDGSCVVLEVYEITGVTNPQAGTVETYTYTETAGSTYEWTVVNGTIISGQGTPTIEVEWGDIGEGSVTVIETNEVECESPPVVLDVTVPVGIDEFAGTQAEVFPNPSSGQFQLTVQPNMIGMSVTIFNELGQGVGQKLISSETTSFDLSDLPSGRYTLSISGKHGVISEAVLLVR